MTAGVTLRSLTDYLFSLSTPKKVWAEFALMFFWVSCFGLFLVPTFTAHMVGMMPIDLVFPVTPAAIGSHELYAQLLLVD